VNARKSNRRSLTMLAALVAIAMLGNGVGLIIHYGLTGHSVAVRAMPIAHDLTSNASSYIEQSTRHAQHDQSTGAANYQERS
jgi:hypothetical protein